MSAAPRRPRSDVARNRELLLDAARTAFAGGDAVALETIARDAGVGIGTLYRHFPTRDALVEAVYGAELDGVVEAASGVLAELPPDLALRAWLARYAEFVATKRAMIDALRAGWASGRITTPATRERITAVLATFLEEGARTATLRADVAPDDVAAMLLGVFLSTAGGAPDQPARLLDLLVDALRPAPR